MEFPDTMYYSFAWESCAAVHRMYIKISYIFLWMIEVNYKDNTKGMPNIIIMTHFDSMSLSLCYFNL